MTERDTDANDTTGTERRSDDAFHVTIPEHVGSRIERRLPETDFDSADEYVTFVLESLLRELDEQDGDVVIEVHDAGPDETGAVQNRLESLGYL